MPPGEVTPRSILNVENLVDDFTTQLLIGPLSSDPILHVAASPSTPPNWRARIENELVLITAVNGLDWTCTRGVEGTTAADHSSGAQVSVVITAGGLNQWRSEGTTTTPLDIAIPATSISSINTIIAAAPAGSTIRLPAGTVTSAITIARPNINLIGTGRPLDDPTSTPSGTLLIGHISVTAPNVTIGQLTIDQRTTPNTYDQAIVVTMPTDTTRADFYGHDLTFIGAGAAQGSFHGLLIQPGTGALLERWRAFGYQHGVVARGNQITIRDGYAEDMDADAVIIKSSHLSGAVNAAVDNLVERVLAVAKTAGKTSNFIVIQDGTQQPCKGNTIRDCTSYNARDAAFQVIATNSGTPDGTLLEGCRAYNTIVGASGDASGFNLGATSKNTQLTNCITENCATFSYWNVAPLANNNSGRANKSINPTSQHITGAGWAGMQINGIDYFFRSAETSWLTPDQVHLNSPTGTNGAGIYQYNWSGSAQFYNGWRQLSSTTLWKLQASSGANSIGGHTWSVTGLQMDTSGRLGVQAQAPVASTALKLPAGITTQAPLQLTTGVNLTTPVNGSFEYDGTNLFFTVGTTRKTVTLT